MDVGDAVAQAGPVVVIVVVVVGRSVMASVVVMAVVLDGMRVGVGGLGPEARESDDGREEESQELCRMESSHSPNNRPGEPHSQKYCRAFWLRQGTHSMRYTCRRAEKRLPIPFQEEHPRWEAPGRGLPAALSLMLAVSSVRQDGPRRGRRSKLDAEKIGEAAATKATTTPDGVVRIGWPGTT